MNADQESPEMTTPVPQPQYPRYPSIEVELSDGNVYAVIGDVAKALRHAKVPATEIEEFRAEAISGDYQHAIQTAMRWVDVS